jgi:hypothetical protein
MNARLVAGIALLITSVALYIYLAFMFNPVQQNIPDDAVAWIASYAKASSSLEDYCGAFHGACAWVLKTVYYAVNPLSVQPSELALMGGVFLILSAFLLYFLIFKDALIAGFSTTLLSSSPVFIYWFKPSNYGFPAWFFTGLLAIALTALYLSTRRKTILVAVSIAYGLALTLYPGAWVLSVVTGIAFLLALLYEKPSPIHVYSLIAWLAAYVAPVFLLGTSYLTSICLLGIIWLATPTVLAGLLYRSPGKASVRFFTAFFLTVFSILLSIYLFKTGLLTGYMEIFTRRFNPVIDYGILGIFSLMGLVVYSRSEILAGRGFDRTIFPAGFLLGLILPYVDPTSTLSSLVFLAPLVGITLISVFASSLIVENFKRKILFATLSIIILTGGVGANVAYSISIVAAKPSIYLADMDLYLGIGEKLLNESAWASALEALKADLSRSGGNALVVSYWDYSWWILGYLGGEGDVKVLSSPLSDVGYKRLVSWVLLSDELTAVKILKNISETTGVSTVYLVVSTAFSLSLTGGKSNNAYLGAVTPGATTQYGVQLPYYAAAGDLYRLPLYSSLINKSYLEFINTGVGRTAYEVPLAWNTRGGETLLATVIVDGLSKSGFNVYNVLYSQSKLSSTLKYFELVNVSAKPVYSVAVSFYSYEVNYAVLVYRLNVKSVSEVV